MVNFSLEGKIALVTGASYGIGFGIASAYAEAGATICFNDLSQEKVDKGIAAYKEIGVDAHGYVCDVTDEVQVQAMVTKINEEVGIIDILVNNAGIIMRKPMLEMEADEFRKVIDVDLNAVGLTLAGGLAKVVGGKCKVRFPDLKGIIQTFHKAVACIDANDLATVAVVIHG